MEDYINMLYYKPCLGEQVANINLIYTLFCRGRNLLIYKKKTQKNSVASPPKSILDYLKLITILIIWRDT